MHCVRRDTRGETPVVRLHLARLSAVNSDYEDLDGPQHIVTDMLGCFCIKVFMAKCHWMVMWWPGSGLALCSCRRPSAESDVMIISLMLLGTGVRLSMFAPASNAHNLASRLCVVLPKPSRVYSTTCS